MQYLQLRQCPRLRRKKPVLFVSLSAENRVGREMYCITVASACCSNNHTFTGSFRILTLMLDCFRDWAQHAPQHGHGWVPPEAAQAAADHAQQHGSWTCSMCTLVNSPSAATCEACTASRPKHGSGGQASATGPTAAASPALADASAAGVKAGKQKKLPKFEKLRLTGGDAAATYDWLETSGGTKKKNPQNAWGVTSAGSTARSSAATVPPAMPAAWGNTGSASQRDRAASSAWRKS